MKGGIILGWASLLVAAPAQSATILLHPGEPEHYADFNLGMHLGEGVYIARFVLDRPAQPGSVLTFIYNVSYDFYGVADGVHYGGNDVPTFLDNAFTGSGFSRILKVQRPYRLTDYWGGDVGYVEERGIFYVDGVFGEFYFASSDPVRLDFDFQRVAEVPEPSSWAMLIAGFGLLGRHLRRRARPALPERQNFAKLQFAKGRQRWASSDYMPGNGFEP